MRYDVVVFASVGRICRELATDGVRERSEGRAGFGSNVRHFVSEPSDLSEAERECCSLQEQISETFNCHVIERRRRNEWVKERHIGRNPEVAGRMQPLRQRWTVGSAAGTGIRSALSVG
jgi:hypothetical protein